MIPIKRIISICLLSSILVSGCQTLSGLLATDTPVPTATTRPTSTPMPTATTQPTFTPSPTATTQPTLIPTATKSAPAPVSQGLFHCEDALGCVKISPGDSNELASLQAISGPISHYGENSNRVIQIAIDDHAGELLGFPITLTAEDSECSRSGGLAAATKIAANPQIVAAIGTTCSGAASPASQILSDSGILMVSASNTSPVLTAEGYYSGSGPVKADQWNYGYFRTINSDEFQAIAAAKFAFENLGVTTAATIDDDTPYSAGLARAFGEAFEALGGKWVLQTTIQNSDTNMRPTLTTIANSGVEILYIPLFDPAGRYIVMQRGEIAGLEDLILFAADGLLADSFLSAVGQAGVGMYLSGLSEPDNPAYEALRSKYRSAYGEDFSVPFSAYAYDAANMIFAAIESVAIIAKDGSLYIGRQALIDSFYSISEFQGVSGILTCNQFGDCAAPKIAIMLVESSNLSITDLISNPLEIIELSP